MSYGAFVGRAGCSWPGRHFCKESAFLRLAAPVQLTEKGAKEAAMPPWGTKFDPEKRSEITTARVPGSRDTKFNQKGGKYDKLVCALQLGM